MSIVFFCVLALALLGLAGRDLVMDGISRLPLILVIIVVLFSGLVAVEKRARPIVLGTIAAFLALYAWFALQYRGSSGSGGVEENLVMAVVFIGFISLTAGIKAMLEKR